MQSDIDITKSPKEVFFEGVNEFSEGEFFCFSVHQLELLWELAGKPAVNSVKANIQDVKDFLDNSLLTHDPETVESMVKVWITELNQWLEDEK